MRYVRMIFEQQFEKSLELAKELLDYLDKGRYTPDGRINAVAAYIREAYEVGYEVCALANLERRRLTSWEYDVVSIIEMAHMNELADEGWEPVFPCMADHRFMLIRRRKAELLDGGARLGAILKIYDRKDH